MRFRRQKIMIWMDGTVDRFVAAMVSPSGTFAYHRWNGVDEDWAVTHIATGSRINQEPLRTRSDARAFAIAMESHPQMAKVWAGRKFKFGVNPGQRWQSLARAIWKDVAKETGLQ